MFTAGGTDGPVPPIEEDVQDTQLLGALGSMNPLSKLHTHLAKEGLQILNPNGPREGLQKHYPRTLTSPDLTAPNPETLIS